MTNDKDKRDAWHNPYTEVARKQKLKRDLMIVGVGIFVVCFAITGLHFL
ncbi:MAG: hypothetical protein AB7J19_17145 [Beijerinckiaceae bacterium]